MSEVDTVRRAARSVGNSGLLRASIQHAAGCVDTLGMWRAPKEHGAVGRLNAWGIGLAFLRGRFERLGPFLGEGEYSGFGFGEDLSADQPFQLGPGTFDVFR